MTSKRKLYREDEKLFFLSPYYQSGMSKHAFAGHMAFVGPALQIAVGLKSIQISRRAIFAF